MQVNKGEHTQLVIRLAACYLGTFAPISGLPLTIDVPISSVNMDTLDGTGLRLTGGCGEDGGLWAPWM